MAKRSKRKVVDAMVHIFAHYNNTLITFTDLQGNVIDWSSSARCGFRGSKKGTPFAAQTAAESVGKRMFDECATKHVYVKVKGPGSGRELAIKALSSVGLKVLSIEDVTGIPHNGCRPPKKRRV